MQQIFVKLIVPVAPRSRKSCRSSMPAGQRSGRCCASGAAFSDNASRLKKNRVRTLASGFSSRAADASVYSRPLRGLRCRLAVCALIRTARRARASGGDCRPCNGARQLHRRRDRNREEAFERRAGRGLCSAKGSRRRRAARGLTDDIPASPLPRRF